MVQINFQRLKNEHKHETYFYLLATACGKQGTFKDLCEFYKLKDGFWKQEGCNIFLKLGFEFFREYILKLELQILFNVI